MSVGLPNIINHLTNPQEEEKTQHVEGAFDGILPATAAELRQLNEWYDGKTPSNPTAALKELRQYKRQFRKDHGYEYR